MMMLALLNDPGVLGQKRTTFPPVRASNAGRKDIGAMVFILPFVLALIAHPLQPARMAVVPPHQRRWLLLQEGQSEVAAVREQGAARA